MRDFLFQNKKFIPEYIHIINLNKFFKKVIFVNKKRFSIRIYLYFDLTICIIHLTIKQINKKTIKRINLKIPNPRNHRSMAIEF